MPSIQHRVYHALGSGIGREGVVLPDRLTIASGVPSKGVSVPRRMSAGCNKRCSGSWPSSRNANCKWRSSTGASGPMRCRLVSLDAAWHDTLNSAAPLPPPPSPQGRGCSHVGKTGRSLGEGASCSGSPHATGFANCCKALPCLAGTFSSWRAWCACWGRPGACGTPSPAGGEDPYRPRPGIAASLGARVAAGQH